MRYRVLLSDANARIFAYLNLKHWREGNSLVFDGDPQEDLGRIAQALIRLGYARDDFEAHRVAFTFFVNEVRA
jgi:hypothetical protein